jgi:S-DNA-T family DNA segregation ATPase FtsK/SpoIIIE
MIPKDVLEGETEVDDSLYDEVVQFILTQETASTSMIQRKYRIGYNRAARLIDALEENGLIGPSEGSKPRRVIGR